MTDYDDYLRQQGEAASNAATLTESMAQAAPQSPDEYAEALRQSLRSGVTPQWAKEFGKDIEAKAKYDPDNIDDLIRRSPKTAKFLATPDNAAVSHDDVPGLQKTESLFDVMGEDWVAQYKAARDENDKMRMLTQARSKIARATPEELKAMGPRPETGSESLMGRAIGAAGAGVMEAYHGTLLRGAETALDVLSETIGKPLTKPGAPTSWADLATAGPVAAGLGLLRDSGLIKKDPFADLLETVRITRKGFEDYNGTRGGPRPDDSPLTRDVLSGVQSAGQNITQMGAALLASPFIGPLPAAGMALNWMGLSSGFGAYTKATDQGTELVPKLAHAAITGLVEKYTEMIPAVKLLEGLGLNQGVRGAIRLFGSQWIHENWTEQIATHLQDLSEWAFLPENKNKTVMDYLEERPSAALSTLISTTVGTLLQTGAAKTIDVAMNDAGQRRNKAFFEALAEGATDSKLRERMPEKFREFIETATKDGPVREVLVPVAEFEKYFQTQEMDPATVARDLNATNYQEAKLAGTDVAIPISFFTEKIAPTPHMQGLMDDIKLSADQFTARENKTNTEAAQQQMQKQMQELMDLGEAPLTDEEQQMPVLMEMRQHVEETREKLVAAGMEPGTAATQASLMRGVATLAHREFPDRAMEVARQVWGRMGLDIGSDLGGTAGSQQFEQTVERGRALVKAAEGEVQKANDDFFTKTWPDALKRTRSQVSADRPGARTVAASRAVEDVRKFLAENPHYANYYAADLQATRDLLDQAMPDFTDEQFRAFKVFSGMLSAGTPLQTNIREAVSALIHYREKGHFDAIVMVQGKGGNRRLAATPFSLSTTTASNKAFMLKIFDRLTQKYGMENAVAMLEESVSRQELREFNREVGFTASIADIGDIYELVEKATGQSEVIPRAFIFGKKVGAYILNNLGHHEYNTIDIWEGRFIRSYFKDMFDAKVSKGLPENVAEHELMLDFVKKFEQKFQELTGESWDNSALQAVRWFYMIHVAKEGGYRGANSTDTISEYTARAIRRLAGEDQAGGRLGDSADARGVRETSRLYQEVKSPNISQAIVEGKGVAGFDPRLIKVLGGNLYSGDLGQVSVKEMLQNSVDDVRRLADVSKAVISVDVDSVDQRILVKDNGLGMLPEVATKELLDIGGSKKHTEVKSGGFGIAKVAIFANSDEIMIHTVADDADGKRISTMLKGSGDDWLDPSKGLTIDTQDGSGMATGTTIEVKLKKESQFTGSVVQGFLRKFQDKHKLPGKFRFTLDGNVIEPTQTARTDSGELRMPLTTTIDNPHYALDVYVSNSMRTSGIPSIEILNNGLPQFEHYFYKHTDVAMPERITVNVRPKTGPEDPGYPFSSDRQRLRGGADVAIEEFVMSIATTGTLREIQKYKQALKSAPRIPGTSHKIVDTGNNFATDSGGNPEHLKELAARPYQVPLTRIFNQALKRMSKAMAPYHSSYTRVQFLGIGLGQKYLGVNISGMGSSGVQGSDELILMNPYVTAAEIADHITNGHVANEVVAAEHEFYVQLASTLLHEITHQAERGHGVEFAGALTRNQGRLLDEFKWMVAALHRAFEKKGINLYAEVIRDYDRLVQPAYDNTLGEDIFGKISTSTPGNELAASDNGDPQRSEGGGPGLAEALPGGSVGAPGELAASAAHAADLNRIGSLLDQVPDPNQPQRFYQTESALPRLFSQLTRSLQAAKQQQAPAKDWLAIISKLPGVKKEEIEFTGIKEYIELIGAEGEQISRDLLVNYAEHNGLEIEEVMLGEPTRNNAEWERLQAEVERLNRSLWPENSSQFSTEQRKEIADRMMANRARQEQIEAEWEKRGATKFARYTLPGGENYRELLMRLPPDLDAFDRDRHARQKALEAERDALDARLTPYNLGQIGASRELDELRRQRGNLERRITMVMGETGSQVGFRAGHWDQSNVITHIRFNERTDADDGKKVLFIEEIQSDWAQKGKKEGFAGTPLPPATELDIALYFIPPEVPEGHDPQNYPGYWESFDVRSGEMITRHGGRMTRAAAMTEAIEFAEILVQERKGAVPTGPFVTDTKAWVGLALKRMLAYAAEHGFDRVAWTTGAQNADRYDLRKSLDSIAWNTNDGRKYITLKGLKGISNQNVEIAVDQKTGIIGTTDIGTPGDWEGKHLADVLGKEVAQKILNDEGAPEGKIEQVFLGGGQSPVFQLTRDAHWIGDYATQEEAEKARAEKAKNLTLTGDNLKVGGEGMKAFYDKIVPQVANDVLKKLGGGKVGTVALPGSKLETADWTSTGGDNAPSAEFSLNAATGRYYVRTAMADDPGGDANDWHWVITDTGLSREQAEQKVAELNSPPRFGPPMQQPGIDITPALRAQVLRGQPLFQEDDELGDKKAFFEIDPATRKSRIVLLEKRDLSSFLHETGHFYLEVLGDFAAMAGGTGRAKQDYETILKWLNVKDRSEIKAEHHEKFARGFELYLREGKAPSIEMRGAFRRFSAWLKLIYQEAINLHVTINDDVRQVFDRILASDEEIQNAAQQVDVAPMITSAEQVGWTEEEFKLYQDAAADIIEEGREELQLQLMREMEKAQSKERKAELNKVKKEMGEEADRAPLYQALKALSTGKTADGTEAKLNRESVTAAFGKDVVDRLPQQTITNAGNLDADTAAAFFGFPAGEMLIQSLVAMETREAYIERRADEIMKGRHGDIRTDGSIAARAQEALHNEQRAKVIRMEMAALRRKKKEFKPVVDLANDAADQAGKEKSYEERWRDAEDNTRQAGARGATNVPPTKFFRDAARDLISRTAIRNLDPNRYLQAEKKSSREAFEAMAAEEFDVAAEAKQKELLSHYLWVEAVKAKEDADAILKYAKKFDTNTVRQAMGKAGADYLEQIDALLDRYEFRDVSNRKLDKRQALAAWVAAQELTGAGVQIDERLLDESRRVNYRDVPIDELRAIRDAVKNIEHLARLKNQLVYKNKMADFQNAKAEMIQAAIENVGMEVQQYSDSARPMSENAKNVLRGLDAGLVKIEQLMMWLDGDNASGPWHRYIWNPLKAAQHDLNDDTKAVVSKIDEITNQMPKAWRKSMLDRITIPGDTMTRTRKDLIGMALNLGNAENQGKMLAGNFPDSPNILAEIHARMTADDWRFVQNVWDLIATLRPKIGEIQKRLTGLEPEWVTPVPFTAVTAAGEQIEMAGGYYPLVADRNSGVGLKQEADIFQESYLYPVTSHGFTKARVTAKYPLDFNWDRIVQHHLVKVIKDYTHREAVLAANKILLDQQIRDTLIGAFGEKHAGLFRDWLKDIANDTNRSIGEGMDEWSRAFTATRANLVAAIMGFKMTTGISQVTSLFVSLDRVKPQYLTKALLAWTAHPIDMVNSALEQSGELRHRANTMDRDINQRLKQMIGKHGIAAGVQRAAFYGIAAVDIQVAVVTWHGAKEQALRANLTNEEAILEADAAVRLTQGAGAIMDQAAMVRNRGEFWRATTMFYSYFNALYNTGRDIGFQVNGAKDLPKALMRFFGAFVVPLILGDLILQRGPGGDDDDESYLSWAVRKALLSPLATVPFLRDVGNAADHFLSNGAKGQPDIKFSPMATMVEKIVKLGMHVGKDVRGETEFDALQYALEIGEAVGYTFGMPGTAQLAGMARYANRLAEGEENPDNGLMAIYEALVNKRKSSK